MNRAKLDSLRFELSRKGIYLKGLYKFPAKIQRKVFRDIQEKLDKLKQK